MWAPLPTLRVYVCVHTCVCLWIQGKPSLISHLSWSWQLFVVEALLLKSNGGRGVIIGVIQSFWMTLLKQRQTHAGTHTHIFLHINTPSIPVTCKHTCNVSLHCTHPHAVSLILNTPFSLPDPQGSALTAILFASPSGTQFWIKHWTLLLILWLENYEIWRQKSKITAVSKHINSYYS